MQLSRLRIGSRSLGARTRIGIPALLAVVSGLAAGCGDSRSEPVELRYAEFELVVALEPAAARVGENTLWLELHGLDGEPIDDAVIEAAVRMPAMGAMAAMGGPAAVTPLGAGRFRADFELAMGSRWQVEVMTRIGDDAPARAEGSLTVGTRGLRLAAIGQPPRAAASGEDHAGHGAAELTPSASSHPAELSLSPERIQRIGVETTRVERRSTSGAVHAYGRVVAPESGLVDISLKVAGFATRVRADALGVFVKRGETLFEAYSPALLAAQQEYVEALRSQTHARDTSAPDRADALVEAARARLRLWDTDPRELERLTRTRVARERVSITAPISGYVVEKNLVEGGAFEAGERLYRIAPLAKVWIEADVYESELAGIAIGERATVTLPALPDRILEARVTFVQPLLDAATRSLRVRLEVDNPDLALRPNMNANVELEAPGHEGLIVPQSALLQAGRKSFVFRALGDGRFRPQAVEVGRRFGEEVEVLAGLAEGDEIVRSGTFLIAAESRLRAALETW